MTPARFSECLEHLHWSTETLALVLGCDESLTEAYSMGLEEVPMKLGVWLDAPTLAHEAESGKPTGLKGKAVYGVTAVRAGEGYHPQASVMSPTRESKELRELAAAD